MNHVTIASVRASVALTLCGSAAAQCWKPGFAIPGVDGTVSALATFDPGGGLGPQLFAAGPFGAAGTAIASNLARWDGASWHPVVTSGSPGVNDLHVHDDGLGGGPALYACGAFASISGVPASNIARWNGTTWSALGAGTNTVVRTATTYDDGSGPALVIGGYFTSAGGVAASYVAKWNGAAWQALGSGMNGFVEALAVFNDGSGPALYAGGSFTTAGGVAADRIARWNGTTWSALGTGVNSTVFALAAFNDGSGPALFAGGAFTSAGGAAASSVARWNGSTWSSLGAGLSGGSGGVGSLVAFDDGLGMRLYAGGSFAMSGALTVNSIARWNGISWSALASGASAGVSTLHVHDDGTTAGPSLFVGGPFAETSGVVVNGVARWNAAGWSTVGAPGNGANGLVYAATTHDDGTGTALYLGGSFSALAAGTNTRGVARWNGSSASAVGSPHPLTVYALHSHTGVTVGGPHLYAGGFFSISGTPSIRSIARWNGAIWQGLGTGISSPGQVNAIVVHDDGSAFGPAVYAGGAFFNAGGMSIQHLARWNGTSWGSVGSASGFSSDVFALALFDEGAGPMLFAGGSFSIPTAGCLGIARWNGASWSPPGGGFLTSQVRALKVFDDGSGPALYAGGLISNAAGVPVNNIARWTGTSWQPLGAGLNGPVFSLAVFDDPSGMGPALIAGGDFTASGATAVSRIAKWTGSSWQPLGLGLSGATSVVVRALATFNEGTSVGAALYAGGNFYVAGSHPSVNFARYARGCGTATAFCFGDGTGTPCPCANHSVPGANEGCRNSLGLGGRLTAAGAPSLAADTLVLSGSNMPDSFALYFQGTSAVGGGFGAPLGDGLRCAGGSVVRLATKLNAGGMSQYPALADPTISIKGMILGPGVRTYQAWYRNAAAFCTSDTFNLTSAVLVDWSP